jgi:Domain of unknown function (DUF1772)
VEGNRTVAIRNQSRRCVCRRALRSQSRHPSGENTPPRAWPNTGLMFWVYVTTVPLTVLTIANLIAAWLTQGPMRFWYLAAVCIVIVERVATFSYFIPTMVRLTSTEGLAEGDIKAALSQWLLMNHGRHVLTLAGWLAALKALSLSGRPYGNG